MGTVVLYKEQKQLWDTLRDVQSDAVRVELVEHDAEDYTEGDVVLRQYVRVDYKIIISSRTAFSPFEKSRSEFIRLAIKTFDELLDSHPSKDKLQ